MDGGRYAGAYGMDRMGQNYDRSSPQHHQQQQQYNNPCHEGYNPAAPPPPQEAPQGGAYNATVARAAPAPTHHTLLFSAAVSEYNQNQAMAALLGAATSTAPSSYAVQAPPPPSHNNLQLSNAFDPLPLTPAEEQQHQRHSSFDEFLFMSPSLFSDLEPVPDVNGSASGPKSSSLSPLPPPAVPQQQQQQENLEWLDDLSVLVAGLSLEPMSGAQVISRLRKSMDDVLIKYIPCVDFLVQCQQELRKGLTAATQKRVQHGKRYYRDVMTPRQFYATYIDHLPQKFYLKNQFIMEPKALTDAVQGLQKLRSDAKRAEGQGCEAVKNMFLGGMKEGESWGLRRWLSKHGNALHVCTDLECILRAVQKLERSAETTKMISDIMRPRAKQTLDRLKSDIPASYQERSAAHPYLPFFHRLEAALIGISKFDPGEEEVICLDDSDDEDEPEARAQMLSPSSEIPPARGFDMSESSKKRKADEGGAVPSKRFSRVLTITDTPKASGNGNRVESSSGESDDDSVIEIVGVKPAHTHDANVVAKAAGDWKCASCSMLNAASTNFCLACGEENMMKDYVYFPTFDDLIDVRTGLPASLDSNLLANGDHKLSAETHSAKSQPSATSHSLPAPPPAVSLHWPVPIEDRHSLNTSAHAMAERLDQLAGIFDQNQQAAVRPSNVHYGSFWDGDRYAGALRLFGNLLRRSESAYFVRRVDEDRLIQEALPPYSHVIKHPICFRDIVSALIKDAENTSHSPACGDGRLPNHGLSSWNMWKGMDLLQAIDLVFLNSLAYGKAIEEGKSHYRSQTNKLRKALWNGINEIVVRHCGIDNERRKQFTPTRRSESSGFVVYKIKH